MAPRIQIAFVRIAVTAIAMSAVGACGGSDGSPTEAEPPPNYAGVWVGQTATNRAVRMVVNSAGVVDSLSITVRLFLGAATCTGPLSLQAPVSISGTTFAATIVYPASGIESAVQGTFSSATSLSGSYGGYSGGFGVICGNSISIGTGSPLSSGTFQATKN